MMNRIIVGLGVGLLFGLTQSTDAQESFRYQCLYVMEAC